MKGKFHWLIALCITLACFGVVAAWAALPPSGQLSFSQIQTEFGGSNPISISEYYRGGALVPNTGANASIPTSGQISVSNFYNGSSSNILLNSTGTAGSASGRVGYSFTFSFGTMSPVVTTDSRTVLDMYDQSGVGFLSVSGFGADPGQTGWATTIFVNGIPFDPTSAIGYSYAVGVAQWQFMGGFGFSNGVGYTVTIVQ